VIRFGRNASTQILLNSARYSVKLFLAFAAIAVLFSAAAAQAAKPGCAASHYKVIPLPLQPVHINNSGMIAGTTARIDEPHKPALWTENDGLRVIDLPAGFDLAEPRAINGAGDIVGTAERGASPQSFAFRYSKGKFSLLTEESAKAMAINDSGEIAGQIGMRLVLWSKDSQNKEKDKILSLGGCCGGTVHAIDASGQVIGQLNDQQSHYGAFIWDATHGMHSIAPQDAAMSSAFAISSSGHILVRAYTPNAVYIRKGEALTPVALSPEYASQALGLNLCDVVVGEFGASSEWNHAFIWDEKNGFRDLNKLIGSEGQWTLESAFDINDRGEIIGVGDRGAEQDIGFLLVPER
jgi:uncharacterized membrane protein